MLWKRVAIVDIRLGFTTDANDFFSLEPLGRGSRRFVRVSAYRCGPGGRGETGPPRRNPSGGFGGGHQHGAWPEIPETKQRYHSQELAGITPRLANQPISITASVDAVLQAVEERIQHHQ
ncbi:MAG: hypothetical protein Q9P14_09520 [candidate division KSB1 bacterium]|nr:hypothetical protein [candidate division KSB1 bacterium]